jgi:hypothetical protein
MPPAATTCLPTPADRSTMNSRAPGPTTIKLLRAPHAPLRLACRMDPRSPVPQAHTHRPTIRAPLPDDAGSDRRAPPRPRAPTRFLSPSPVRGGVRRARPCRSGPACSTRTTHSSPRDGRPPNCVRPSALARCSGR